MQGEASTFFVGWGPSARCGFSTPCSDEVTTTLLDAECDGCQILPRTTTTTVNSEEALPVHVVPTSDGLITLRATLRYDTTGDVIAVSVNQQGDHEVTFSASCWVADTMALAAATQGRERDVPQSLFQPCSGPRLATESVVLFPVIYTFRGRSLFPFATAASATSGVVTRMRSQLVFSTGEPRWARSDLLPTRYFVEIPNTFTGTSATITAPLADGTTTTLAVDIPGVR